MRDRTVTQKTPLRVALSFAALPLLVACSGMLKSSAPDEQVYVLHPVAAGNAAPVSYTHLTLPTICSV